MKKLLLTFVLSIIGFMGFSSAYNLTQNFSFSPEGGVYYFPSSLVGQTVNVKCVGQPKLGLFFDCAAQYFPANSSSVITNLTNGCSITYYGSDNSVNCSYSYQSDTLGFNQLGVLFTPVVSGLKNTFFQLVPLIVYLGIGLLLVTLGFVVVRWLLNWMGIKINSIFRSKRG